MNIEDRGEYYLVHWFSLTKVRLYDKSRQPVPWQERAIGLYQSKKGGKAHWVQRRFVSEEEYNRGIDPIRLFDD
ncbi:hypothetical protein [Vibrio hannami]